MQTQAAAEAMAHDGVMPETFVVLVEQQGTLRFAAEREQLGGSAVASVAWFRAATVRRICRSALAEGVPVGEV